MNKTVVVFLKKIVSVNQIVESGIFICNALPPRPSLVVPSARVTVSGVPPFISNTALEQELRRFGKFASPSEPSNLVVKTRTWPWSLRRRTFMFLEDPSQTLDVSFIVKHRDYYYTVYASTGSLRFF